MTYSVAVLILIIGYFTYPIVHRIDKYIEEVKFKNHIKRLEKKYSDFIKAKFPEAIVKYHINSSCPDHDGPSLCIYNIKCDKSRGEFVSFKIEELYPYGDTIDPYNPVILDSYHEDTIEYYPEVYVGTPEFYSLSTADKFRSIMSYYCISYYEVTSEELVGRSVIHIYGVSRDNQSKLLKLYNEMHGGSLPPFERNVSIIFHEENKNFKD